MQENNSNFMMTNQLEENDSMNLREEIDKYLIYWKWFVLSLILALGLAFVYLRYTTPTYSATGSIMIKDNQKSGISTELAAFEDLGIIGGGSANNPENEIEILKSRKIIGHVVDSLDLQIQYFYQGRVKTIEMFGSLPFKIQFLGKSYSKNKIDTTFVVTIQDAETLLINDIEKEQSLTTGFNINLGNTKHSFQIIKTEDLKSIHFNKPIVVAISSRDKVIDNYRGRINISTIDKNSSVLKLNLIDAVKTKATAILDELVKQYNMDAINDKNLVSKKTKNFINERLKTVGGYLALAQDDVKDYKTKYGITGLSLEGELALEQVSLNNTKIVDIQSQLSLANWILKKLGKESETNEIIPTNLGFTDAAITSSIAQYNELVLQKNKLVVIAGKLNPQLIELNRQIEVLKKSLLASISNLQKSLEIQLEQLKQEAQKVSAKISNIPLIERGMIDIERQKEIYSELYSYLLKKKEETDISLAVTVPNAKIIDYAYSNGLAVAPKKKINYLVALFIGFLLPLVVIYIKNVLDTKIHSRKDIEDLTTIPFLGDVPHSETDEKVVIKSDSRTSTAEAFRLIRTNLDFMLASKANEKGKTIFVTSTTSGEGKSFISINLAAALSLSNKKVLLLGVDLRAPKVTEYLGIPERKGITNFITNESLTLEDIKFTISEIKDLDIIASGVIPPNPAELLLGDRIKQLFAEVKQDYDFIIVDTAPVNLVTDTFLISKYADITLYVSRANYLDKRMLKVAQNLYTEQKLNNMAIVLNDTDMTRGYGYGYGYSYGYGYGVGYLEEAQKVPWYKRMFKS
ncbi:polysaccharide biosynthesis tyrosine autokinase [Polaribacter vadi]|uniref:GumC family protein n=1 Tax=Polaribacter TaxID=52959 RepID=UPI001C09F291|nr:MULTISPECIES: tyrosine-protein kinase [Polaribacter]MBU3010322.1 polysaccharide biosynthesis tyrosine autokinase [Polaribacter vadi]MDO6740129.1 polysaccharide biosynthesis tyrosine autokinase [Polaribacter sp. 1_MG-2023]